MKIFISHSKKDNEVVKKIVAILNEFNIEYWVDFDQIGEGDSIIGKINEGLKHSTHFFLIWSKNCESSEWVTEEVNAVTSSDYKKILRIPLRLDPTQLPALRFSSTQFHRITQNNVRSIVTGVIEKIRPDINTQMKNFKIRVCSDYEHYVDNPIISSFKKFNGYKFYIHQNGLNKSNNEKIDDMPIYIFNSIRESNKKLIIVTGYYGSGKSLLSNFVFYKICKLDETMPIFVPLGELKKTNDEHIDLEDKIFHHMRESYRFMINKLEFKNLITDKKLIFILDSLDEMSQTIDKKIVGKIVNQIKKLSEKITIVVTARQTYLHKDLEDEFKENIYNIQDFSKSKINEFLERKYHENKNIILKIKSDIRKPNLITILSKPLFLNIFSEKYLELENSLVINEITLLKTLIDDWILHDVKKLELEPELEKKKINVRQRCSEKLAILQLKKGKHLTLDEIKNQIKEEFKHDHSNIDDELEQYYHDARDCTFLDVEKNDSFSFRLQPILEYFVARRITNDINNFDKNHNIENIELRLNDEIFSLIGSILEIEWAIKPHVLEEILKNGQGQTVEALNSKMDHEENLIKIIEETKTNKKSNAGGNAVTILHNIKRFPVNVDFSKTKLSHARLDIINFPDGKFRKSILNNVNFAFSYLPDTDFHGANLFESDFLNAILSGADLSKTNLSGSRLARAILVGIKLKGANLHNADIRGARLWSIDLTDVNLNYVKFDQYTEFRRIRIGKIKINSLAEFKKFAKMRFKLQYFTTNKHLLRSFCVLLPKGSKKKRV